MNVKPKQPTDQAQVEPLKWLEEHGDALLSYASARVGDDALAEDFVQETFVAAIAARDEFRGDSSVRTWLIGILRHHVADYYRRQSRRPIHSNVPVEDQLAGPLAPETLRPGNWPADPKQAVENAEFRSKLEECLQKLPKTVAGAFILRAMDGLSVKELCNVFDVSATNLRVRLHRARVSLRDCLSKNWL